MPIHMIHVHMNMDVHMSMQRDGEPEPEPEPEGEGGGREGERRRGTEGQKEKKRGKMIADCSETDDSEMGQQQYTHNYTNCTTATTPAAQNRQNKTTSATAAAARSKPKAKATTTTTKAKGGGARGVERKETMTDAALLATGSKIKKKARMEHGSRPERATKANTKSKKTLGRRVLSNLTPRYNSARRGGIAELQSPELDDFEIEPKTNNKNVSSSAKKKKKIRPREIEEYTSLQKKGKMCQDAIEDVSMEWTVAHEYELIEYQSKELVAPHDILDPTQGVAQCAHNVNNETDAKTSKSVAAIRGEDENDRYPSSIAIEKKQATGTSANRFKNLLSGLEEGSPMGDMKTRAPRYVVVVISHEISLLFSMNIL